jgi:hypothetical protein
MVGSYLGYISLKYLRGVENGISGSLLITKARRLQSIVTFFFHFKAVSSGAGRYGHRV